MADLLAKALGQDPALLVRQVRLALGHAGASGRRRRVDDGGSDGAQDVHPSGIEGIVEPIHALVLVAMGMPIFDNLDLEAVSKEAAKRNRWDFLVTAAPLAIPGATGSPLNPIATF